MEKKNDPTLILAQKRTSWKSLRDSGWKRKARRNKLRAPSEDRFSSSSHLAAINHNTEKSARNDSQTIKRFQNIDQNSIQHEIKYDWHGVSGRKDFNDTIHFWWWGEVSQSENLLIIARLPFKIQNCTVILRPMTYLSKLN